jgi:HD-GYP domain-containing protein (c-di-GMP phosphodiesterase class II)
MNALLYVCRHDVITRIKWSGILSVQRQHRQDAQHYLRAVTELGDTRKIVAHRDVYSQSGMKLVAAGIHITGDLYEHLVMHKMLPSLEMALAIENMLDQKAILQDVLELIQKNDKLKKMAGILGGGDRYRRIILAIQLPAPLAFKLTVAREKYHRIYQHSLRLLIISIYLAHCDGLDVQDEEWMVTAALFHDIGLLHIDPALLEPSHVMSAEERRHLYAHPLIAYLLLCEFPELPRQIADAVLEHHERMDGSGYPRGLHGEKISRYGQILAVAELAAKVSDAGHPDVPWKKLEMMLKLNSRRYGQGFVKHLNIFRDDAGEPSESHNPEPLIAQVNLIAGLFENFNQHSAPAQRDKIFDYAQTRLAMLRLSLFEAGFDPRDPEKLIQLFADDPDSMTEYAPLLDETLWRFKSLMQEISRLWPEESNKDDCGSEKLERAWLSEMKLLLLNEPQAGRARAKM